MNEGYERFLNAVADCPGFDREGMVAAHQAPLPVSVRLNPARGKSVSDIFGPFAAASVPWCKTGWYLNERPSFTLDPHLHAGSYYVQEASSMFIGHALENALAKTNNLKALDLCAAPGGKTTLLAALPNFRMIVANEIIQTRVPVLLENLTKWGARNVFITNNDPSDFSRLPGFFDVILVDAPCSGSGLFRKDDAAIKEWSEQAVSFCSQRQRRILENAAISLVEGGILVYSTCSFSKAENEDNLEFLVEQGFESLQVETDPSWGVVESITTGHQAFGYRFYPDKLKGEGFFCAILRKSSPDAGGVVSPMRLPASLSPTLFSSWLAIQDEWFFFEKEEDVYGCDAVNAQDLFLIRSHLRIRKSGLRLGRLIRGELVPDHELALSDALSQDLPSLVLEKPDAIRFLRRDDLPVAAGGKGWHIVKYDGVSLGWAKLVQGKVKNNYPMTWRILMKP
ncbi:MAG: hypothetical protein RLY85_2095 [Bacteroidota bacterium]|jgi:16S rRNA C967 or C1407 C5-methylase (RsmB/RsmF family)/NOL1/NOP2/fmu family ribosome biogenesis protein